MQANANTIAVSDARKIKASILTVIFTAFLALNVLSQVTECTKATSNETRISTVPDTQIVFRHVENEGNGDRTILKSIFNYQKIEREIKLFPTKLVPEATVSVSTALFNVYYVFVSTLAP